MVPIRRGEDPSVKTSKEELTRGVVITYVDDLLLTGWQTSYRCHHKGIVGQVRDEDVWFHSQVKGRKRERITSDGIDILGARTTRDDGTVWV